MDTYPNRPSWWASLSTNTQLAIVAGVCLFFVVVTICAVIGIGAILPALTPTATPRPTETATSIQELVPSETPAFEEDPLEGPFLSTPMNPMGTLVATPTVLAIGGFSNPTPSFLPVQNAAQVPDGASAQSGGVMPTAVPTIVWPPVSTPVWQPQPTAWAPIPTVIPVPAGPPAPPLESPVPLPMPPLNVTAPWCEANPVFANVQDPRIGCRMPSGVSITSVAFFANQEQSPFLMSSSSSNWMTPNTPAVPSAGTVLIWSARNNVSCVAWNPTGIRTIGSSDSIRAELTMNNGQKVSLYITVQPSSRGLVNPPSLTHSCGFSPDGTKLHVEVGDTLARFIRGVDLPDVKEAYRAWWNKYRSYNLEVGRTYDVPAEWLGQPSFPPGGTK